jgi:YidC/Oxa1 family membrane protein insertase
MESARTFLFILFAFLTFLLYNAWTETNAPKVVVKAPIETSIENYQPGVAQEKINTTANTGTDLSSELPQMETASQIIPEQATDTQVIEVVTDSLRVLISPVAGNLVSAELLDYKETLAKNSEPINILENRDGRVFLALSGLYGEGAPDFDKNVAIYSTEQKRYQLDEGEDSLNVDLTWTNAKGVEYTKRFTFHRGEHFIDVGYQVDNRSQAKIANRMFTALRRDSLEPEGQVSEGIGMTSYIGPAISTQDVNYEKFSFDDLEERPLSVKTQKGWVAILQHYFVTAWVPQGEGENKIDSTTKGLGQAGLHQIRITQDWQWINPGEIGEFKAKLYVGPKVQSALERVGEHLKLTVDYGFLWWIGLPIFQLLIFFQKFAVNWGLTIILLTITIKMLLYPLARAQYRSFAKMRLLQPQMTAMKERYGDDRQQMSVKMMELYKKEKVNPLGGCFPLLIQMPVFIALYWVLMESVELRHAPFILWINDLSVKDPYFILPLLMGASMYLMQKMQPVSPAMDPMQAKMLQMMPVFMTVFFVFFPAGLVLYWLMNNLISIAQQIYITKQFDREQEAKKAS